MQIDKGAVPSHWLGRRQEHCRYLCIDLMKREWLHDLMKAYAEVSEEDTEMAKILSVI